MVLRAGRVALLAALAAAGCGGAPEPRASDPSRAARESVDGRFVPAAHRAGGRAVMPVMFTDGRRVELRYPPRLRLAELGVAPYGSGTLHGDSPSPGGSDFVGRDFVIRHGDVEDWRRPHDLAFQFGRWAVLVYDYPRADAAAMTAAERAAWRRSFSGRETRDGFLRLKGRGPLRLARAGGHAGPMLAFGNVGRGRWLQIDPSRCRPNRDFNRRIAGKRVSWLSRRYANWCLSRSMRIAAQGNREFIRALIRRLDLVTER